MNKEMFYSGCSPPHGIHHPAVLPCVTRPTPRDFGHPTQWDRRASSRHRGVVLEDDASYFIKLAEAIERVDLNSFQA